MFWSGAAQATTIFTLGNHPQVNEENIFLNTGDSGSTVLGLTNTSNITVSFSSTTDTLSEPSNGQARIEAADQLLNQLAITVPGGFFTDFIFDALNGSGTATVSATANEPGGGTAVSTFSFALGNGSNFLTVVTADGETLANLNISAPNGFADLRQPRISGAALSTTTSPVPEPASLTLLGTGVLAFIARRRRNRQS
jgi:PEP-CTERM motif